MVKCSVPEVTVKVAADICDISAPWSILDHCDAPPERDCQDNGRRHRQPRKQIIFFTQFWVFFCLLSSSSDYQYWQATVTMGNGVRRAKVREENILNNVIIIQAPLTLTQLAGLISRSLRIVCVYLAKYICQSACAYMTFYQSVCAYMCLCALVEFECKWMCGSRFYSRSIGSLLPLRVSWVRARYGKVLIHSFDSFLFRAPASFRLLLEEG